MRLSFLPNFLTLIRGILIVPIIYYLLDMSYEQAFFLFVFTAITDSLDGLLARRFGWTTRFGSIADPLIDKLMIASMFITLAWMGQLPLWLLGVVVFRDIWIICGATAYHFLIGDLEFKPTFLSKMNTFCQIALIMACLMDLSYHRLPPYGLNVLVAIVVLTTVFSLFHYTWIFGSQSLRRLKGGNHGSR